MNTDEIKSWAAETRLIDEKGLRGSKHQRKIKEIQVIVRRMAEKPTPEDMYSLIHMHYIECESDTRFVSHCRYLQNRVQWLRSRVRLNEGTKDEP